MPTIALNSSSCPIGVFDSGVGGLSILQEIRQQLPHEDLIYVGDILHAPYGSKSLEFIFERAILICDFLIAKQVKAIVVACNTATVSVVKLLRARYTLPIIGVEPAVKPAALNSLTGQVGVLATQRTLDSTSFLQLMQQFEHKAKFHTKAASGLVEKIEQAQLHGEATLSMLKDFIEPMLVKNIDALVLGCTHYPFIKPLLNRFLPDTVTVYDTATPVAKELQRRLALAELLCVAKSSGNTQFYTSGNLGNAQLIMSQLLQQPLNVKSL